ncbi:Uncharacterised protein [Mycobacterium tuberculosis]|uniref:Uncharacterized protein n=1 Tax=Mycobacterium tuberculosis TaxID=1773 RepID=A0A655F9M9_MYCTX|nr:Uncharacterised protein [Mycobacterium tuberculosis]CNU30551.1 Uncharacterised protein [Mycobacterium tuberculosis]CNU98709.1 Uncharacterised protein [Mycobacterium tuberculosis]CNV24490.1 Uncharacterised protein [Mycobacterium tuberculosis]CNV57406.1 Uncharacterised protein [Mycobacterium tuberculosis]
MSCNVKASDPDSTVAPDFLVELATSSNSLEPDASVRLNAVSSATAIRLIRSKSATSSGYDGPIALRTVAIRSPTIAASMPSSLAERITRRSSRRST